MYTRGENRLNINSNGAVGIPILNAGTLTANGDINVINHGSGGKIKFWDNHHAIYGRVGYGNEVDKMQFREYGDIEFWTGGLIQNQSNQMSITSTGNVIISGGTSDHIQTPDGNLKITKDGIMFGGTNNGKELNSAQISAGKHERNSLNIVGMSSGTGYQDRRVDIWAEGGLHLQGGVLHAPKGIRIGRWYIGPYPGMSKDNRGGTDDLVIRDVTNYNKWAAGQGGEDASYYIKPDNYLSIKRGYNGHEAQFR
jgi:hypothetical protein